MCPAFEDEVLATYDRLKGLGIDSFTLLLVPQYGMKKSNSFEANLIFVEYIQSLNLEVSLHGYSHMAKSGSLDEFHRMPQERLKSRIRSGVSAIRKTFGIRPTGFIPPLWQATKRILDVAKEIGFQYCVDGREIHGLLDSTGHQTAELIVSQGKAKASYVDALVELELGGSVQIGVHPLDCKDGEMFTLLEDMKDRLEYGFVGYLDFLVSQ